METINSQPAVPNTSPPSPAVPQPPVKKNLDFANIFKKLPLRLKLALGALLILVTIIIILLFLSPKRENPPLVLVNPSPTPGASFSPLPQVTSEFSKTDVFKRFEESLNSLQKDASSVDFDQTNLAYPLLDMQVNFGGR